MPDVLRDLPRPLVGWAGSFNWRIDLRLLEAAQRAVGDGSLIAIGGGYAAHLAPEVRAFLASGRVISIGEIPGPELPAYLSALDVGLVPYTTEPFNRKSFPIKVLLVPQVSTGTLRFDLRELDTDGLPGFFRGGIEDSIRKAADPAGWGLRMRIDGIATDSGCAVVWGTA